MNDAPLTRRCKAFPPPLSHEARDETAELTEEAAKVERELRTHRVRDERVAGL